MRHDVEPDGRPALAANLIDDVGELHIDDVFHGSAFALADADNLIFDFQLALLLRRAPLHNPLNDRIAVVPLQRRADSLEIQSHHNRKVLIGFRGHIGRVRIVRVGDRGEIDFEDVVVARLAQALLKCGIAAHELGDGVVGAAVEGLLFNDFLALLGGFFLFVALFRLKGKELELYALAHTVGRFRVGRRVLEELLIALERFVFGKVELVLFEERARGRAAFVDALQEPVVNHIGGREIAFFRGLGHRSGKRGVEFVDVALHEVDFARIDRLEIELKTARGNGFVELFAGDVSHFQHSAEVDRNVLIADRLF